MGGDGEQRRPRREVGGVGSLDDQVLLALPAERRARRTEQGQPSPGGSAATALWPRSRVSRPGRGWLIDAGQQQGGRGERQVGELRGVARVVERRRSRASTRRPARRARRGSGRSGVPPRTSRGTGSPRARRRSRSRRTALEPGGRRSPTLGPSRRRGCGRRRRGGRRARGPGRRRDQPIELPAASPGAIPVRPMPTSRSTRTGSGRSCESRIASEAPGPRRGRRPVARNVVSG